MNTAKRPFSKLPHPQQAGILCSDRRFRRFAAQRCGLQDTAFGETATVQFLRTECDIVSRWDLTIDQTAATKFQALLTEFDA